MRVAILINTFYLHKGMDFVAEQQALELVESGHDVTIFTFDYNHLVKGVTIETLNWPKIMLFNLIYRLIYPFDIYKNLRFSKKLKSYDVLICHFYPMTFLAYFTKKRYPSIKYIYYNHGISDAKSTPLLVKIFTESIRFWTNTTISNSDFIISISHYLQNSLINKNSVKKVIFNKICVKKFNYQNSNIDEKLLKINNKKGPIFLYVGVLAHYKGIQLLIESYIKTIGKYPEAKLLLVGNESYGFNLKNYSLYSSKNIHHLNSINDNELGFLYSICDVYVSASTWEGFNLPIVEAQLLGKPVVAFDIGPHKEVVNKNITGILVEPFNTTKFADAMIEVYNNRQIMGEHAKKWAFKFSTENHESESISKFIDEWVK